MRIYRTDLDGPIGLMRDDPCAELMVTVSNDGDVYLQAVFLDDIKRKSDNVQNFSHIFLGARPVKFSSA